MKNSLKAELLEEFALHHKMAQVYSQIVQDLLTATVARPELWGMPSWQNKYNMAKAKQNRHSYEMELTLAELKRLERA